MKKTHALGELVKSMTASFGAAKVDQYSVTLAGTRVVSMTTGKPSGSTHFQVSALEPTPHDGDVLVVKEVIINPSDTHDKLCIDFSDRSGQHSARIMLPLDPADSDISIGYRYPTLRGSISYTKRVDHLSADAGLQTVNGVIQKLMREDKLNPAQATALLTGFAAYHQHQETLRGSDDHTVSNAFRAAAADMAAREERDWQRKLQDERDFQTPRGL